MARGRKYQRCNRNTLNPTAPVLAGAHRVVIELSSSSDREGSPAKLSTGGGQSTLELERPPTRRGVSRSAVDQVNSRGESPTEDGDRVRIPSSPPEHIHSSVTAGEQLENNESQTHHSSDSLEIIESEYEDEIVINSDSDNDRSAKGKAKIPTGPRVDGPGSTLGSASATRPESTVTPGGLVQSEQHPTKEDQSCHTSTKPIKMDFDADYQNDLQEALRRSLLDFSAPQENQNVQQAGPATNGAYPHLPNPDQVPTIGASEALSALGITLTFEDVQVHNYDGPAPAIMVATFPTRLTGGKDLHYCISMNQRSVLFVWDKNAGLRGMGKVRIPDGYDLMPTIEKVKICDTGSGFSDRKWLVGIVTVEGYGNGNGFFVVKVAIKERPENKESNSEAGNDKNGTQKAVDSDVSKLEHESGKVPKDTEDEVMEDTLPENTRSRSSLAFSPPAQGPFALTKPVYSFGTQTGGQQDFEVQTFRTFKTLEEEMLEDELLTSSSDQRKRENEEAWSSDAGEQSPSKKFKVSTENSEIEDGIKDHKKDGNSSTMSLSSTRNFASGFDSSLRGMCVKSMDEADLDGEDVFGMEGGELYVPKSEWNGK